MPHAPDLSGVALDGRYELHALIGEGAFGRVYRGCDRRLARPVAVKVIKPWWAEDPEWAARFEHEARLLASISDPGIVQIFDVGSAPEGLYYVTELVDGESLAARLGRGPIEAGEACEIAEQLARGLGRAHAQHVVHRDVKPANVLIASNGRVKVADLGVARLAEATSDAAGGTVAGTPRYMAPEQARGGPTSPATDVYGIGVVLYEMLAGHPPFAGSSPVELALHHLHDPVPPLPSGTPVSLAEVLEWALAKDPAERYADGDELADALMLARPRDVDREAGGPSGRSAGRGRSPRSDPSSEPGGGAATLVRAEARTVHEAVPEPSVAAPSSRTRVQRRMSDRRNFDPRERRQRIAIFALVATLGLGMVAAAISLTRGDLKVPDLHGLTRAQILGRAKRVDFRAAFSRRYSGAAAGTAIGQSPTPGRRVTAGAAVRVVLSAGPPPVAVPKLVGSSQSEAAAVLGALRLRPRMTRVPAPGVAPGTVTHESPAAGASLVPGSVVGLSVAEVPRWRALTSFSGDANGRSVPFQIRGSRWRIVYSMSYAGMCTFIFFCSGPTATVANDRSGATVDSFGLGQGDRELRTFTSGPGIYQVQISPGSDTARWRVAVEDYY